MLWKTDKYHQPPLKFQCHPAIAHDVAERPVTPECGWGDRHAGAEPGHSPWNIQGKS